MEKIFAIDSSLTQQLTLPLHSSWRRWARLVAHVGDGPYVFGGLGIAYLLGWLWPNPFLRLSALAVAMIVFLAIAAVTLIKFLVRRERPHPPGEFVTFQYDKYSFPSGHSTRMAALAVATTFFYSPLGWILVLVTAAVAAARILVGVHYLSDVVVGLCLGTVVAWGGTTFLLSLSYFMI